MKFGDLIDNLVIGILAIVILIMACVVCGYIYLMIIHYHSCTIKQASEYDKTQVIDTKRA